MSVTSGLSRSLAHSWSEEMQTATSVKPSRVWNNTDGLQAFIGAQWQ
jgi:hypothetical protein